MRVRLLCLLALCLASEVMAAKKDFKGLFGSYRREKFTENEGRSTDFGMDIMLSTLLPVTNLATSSNSLTDTSGAALSYATFFNAELGFFFTLSYHWELFFNIGYYSYDTRKENSPPGATPQFHLFEMESFPVVAGLKYRFSTSDIVPYIGLGAGMVYSRRKAYYDYANIAGEDFSTGLAAQGTLGVEFFISARTGIRLEASAMYLGMPAGSFTGGLTPAVFPFVYFQPNPIAVRYASGLFVLF